MLKIWGRLTSVNVQKVVWCADELGLPYDRIEAGGKYGVVSTPEYRAMNPNGLIPVIDDDGFVLWESNAIVRYLAGRYGEGAPSTPSTPSTPPTLPTRPTLWPTDARARADADRWMDWQAVSFNPVIGPAFIQLVRTPVEQRDMAVVEHARVEAEKRLAILDAHLATHPFVAGAAFTMGDIPLGCSVDRWYKLPIARAAHPNVERWYQALRGRSGAQQVVGLVLA